MKLSDIDKDNIFKVPDGYFDEFSGRLKNKIDESGKKGKSVTISRIVELAVAASISLLLVFSYQIFFNKTDRSASELIAEVPSEALIAYLEETEITTDEVMAALDMSVVLDEDDLIGPLLIPEDELDEDSLDEILQEYELDMQVL